MAGDRSTARREVAVPDLASPGGHYSHAVVGGGLVFISGQLPIAPDGTKQVDASFEAQVRQVLDNVAAALHAASSGVDRLLQVRVYLSDIDNWPTFNRLYAAWVGDAKPARAVLPTGPLHFGFEIEVEAVALMT